MHRRRDKDRIVPARIGTVACGLNDGGRPSAVVHGIPDRGGDSGGVSIGRTEDDEDTGHGGPPVARDAVRLCKPRSIAAARGRRVSPVAITRGQRKKFAVPRGISHRVRSRVL
jgi:hypothetical protein